MQSPGGIPQAGRTLPKQIAGLVVLFACGLLASLSAQTWEWTGNQNDRWNNQNNWSGPAGFPNGVNDVATLGSILASNTTVGLRGTRTVGTLNIQGSQDFTIDRGNGGTRTLRFDVSSGSAALNISGSNSSTIENNVELDLRDNLVLTNTGTGTFSVLGDIDEASGSQSVTINGTGTTVFDGSNSYSGATTINGGTLRITNGGALGNTATGTTVNSGGTLELFGGVTTPSGESLSIGGAGSTSGGALRGSSGANAVDGAITLNSNASIFANSGSTLTLGASPSANNLSLGSSTITFDGGGDTTVNSALTGSGAFIKRGTGTVILSANENFNTGPLSIENGTLELRTNSGSNAALKMTDITVGDGVGGAASAVLRNGPISSPSANEMINNSATVSVNSDGLWNLNNQNEQINALVLTGGSVTTGSGTLRLDAATPITSNASPSTASVSGNILLYGGGTKTIAVADGAAATDLDLSANISQSWYTSLAKTGDGTLRLSGNNTFAGEWTVSDGVLIAASGGALGSTSTSNNNVASGAALRMEGGITLTESNINLSGTGPDGTGALRSLTGANTLNGTVTASAVTRINADAGSSLNLTGSLAVNNDITFGGAGNTQASNSVYGSGGIFKDGTGTLTFSGGGSVSNNGLTIQSGTVVMAKNPNINTFSSGNITVGTGPDSATLRLGANQQINDNRFVTINESGTFDLNGYNESIRGLQMTGGTVTTGAGTLTLTQADAFTSSASANTAEVIGNVQVNQFGATFNVADGAAGVDARFTGPMSGSGGLTKTGSGTLQLAGSTANTRSGNTTVNAGTLELAKSPGVDAVRGSTLTVNSGATLLLSNSNQIQNSTNMTLNGGTFSTGAGNSETLGMLTLTGNSSIDLGSAAHLLQFANSSSLNWAWSGTLTIYGWQGSGGNPGTAGRIFFGNSLTGLTANQLSMISFSGFGPGSILLTNGELVPVIPETRTVVAAILIVLALAWVERKRVGAWLMAAGLRFRSPHPEPETSNSNV